MFWAILAVFCVTILFNAFNWDTFTASVGATPAVTLPIKLVPAALAALTLSPFITIPEGPYIVIPPDLESKSDPIDMKALDWVPMPPPGFSEKITPLLLSVLQSGVFEPDQLPL
ncbi:hypothetical protein BCEP4_880022 [Burkholderia cepacia]|nr:hypothetical protein BCEP4_880022 [Burkholderia cepacia]